MGLKLQVLPSRFAVCRLAPGAAIPYWVAGKAEFVSITRTSAELSVVCPEWSVPAATQCGRGWRALQVAGPLDFSLTGILVSVARPLAEAGVSIFAVSTYDTDYVLVREECLDRAIDALSAAGHSVARYSEHG
jgi:uncharacterized protein